MRINNNIMAMNAHRQYNINNSSIAKSTEKLSSGYRINRAGDDAAGLAISEKMRAQIRGLTMASKNSSDAISLVQTAEGALQESHNILQRMRELAVQSASDTNETSIDRSALQAEFSELINELDDTASKTKFNDMGLIDGQFAAKTTSAESSEYKMAWASSKTETGTYKITTEARELVAAVTGTDATATATNLKVTSTASQLSITFAAATSVKSDSVNGIWNLGFVNDSTGTYFTATNKSTGEIKRVVASAITVGGSLTVDFGDIGTFTITNNGTKAIASNEFSGFTGSVTVKDSVAAKEAQYQHIAKLGGEEVVLSQGQQNIVFNGAGISVTLKNGVNPNKNSATITEGVAGTITVERSGYDPMVIQTGANQLDELRINIEKMDAYSLGVKNASVGSRADASVAITQVNNAINLVSTQRASLGALQNRLNHKISNLDTSAENLQAAESRIRDVDMAKEMTTFTKNNILFQASTAMLAQANAAPQGVLSLLG